MGRQRQNPQSKGMEDSPVKQLNKMEASKLSDTEFKTMRMRMRKELTDNLTGDYNNMKQEIETINENQEEMKNTISEIKKRYTRRKYKQAG